jgi:hypothetical protein
MKIAYFPSQCARNADPVVNAFVQSMFNAGIQVEQNSMTADAAVIWSMLWKGRMAKNQQVWDHYRAQNRPVIVLEVGMLCRGQSWRISVNGVNREGSWGDPVIDPERYKLFGIEPEPWASRGTDILIACQHEHSWQWRNQPGTVAWLTATIQNIRRYTDRRIVVRPHPRSPLPEETALLAANVVIQKPRKQLGQDSYPIDYNQHLIVNFNSSPGVLAVIHGTPVLVDSTSWAAPFSTDFANIERPTVNYDRTDWINTICHREYFVPEIASGTALRNIMPLLHC